MQEKFQDTDIIQLVLNGQKQAYTILVERYQDYVFSLAIRYVNERELAEELAQDVFVKAYRSLRDFKGNSKFSTWLYTIVRTTCISSLRAKKSLLFLTDDISVFEPVTPESTETLMENKHVKQLLSKAINQLNTVDAEVISLFYQAEQSIEEIALITGQSSTNVKVRLFRARHKLKEIIVNQYLYEFSNR